MCIGDILMRCAIYTIVSTDSQADVELPSCEAHEEKIRAFVKSQNKWQVSKVYSDPGFSGANLNRPALQELLEDIKLIGCLGANLFLSSCHCEWTSSSIFFWLFIATGKPLLQNQFKVISRQFIVEDRI